MGPVRACHCTKVLHSIYTFRRLVPAKTNEYNSDLWSNTSCQILRFSMRTIYNRSRFVIRTLYSFYIHHWLPLILLNPSQYLPRDHIMRVFSKSIKTTVKSLSFSLYSSSNRDVRNPGVDLFWARVLRTSVNRCLKRN